MKTEWETELSKKFSPQQIGAALEKTEYEISEIVGRLATMNVQNEALMKKTAAEVITLAAQAFQFRKVGDKYEADAKTVNLFRETLHKIIKGEATIKEVEAYFATANMESSSDLVGYMTSKEGRERKSKAYQIGLEQQSSDLIRC